MKKLSCLFLLIPFLSYSQITITSANLPNIGDTIITASDFSSNYSPGNSGVNQNWNFSLANGMPDMLLGFIDPLLTPYQANFPNSNICAKLDSATYYYLNRSINGLSAVGYVDAGMIYPFSKMLLPTPLSYLDTIINTQILFQFDTVLTPAIPLFFINGTIGPYVVDSIKQVYGNIDKYIVDGWGQVQLPHGSFDALRVFETIFNFDNVSYKVIDTISGISQWVQDSSSSSSYWESSRYSWKTNDSLVNWNLAEIETDSLGNPYGDLVYYLGNSINSIIISPPMVNIEKLVDVSCYGISDGLIMLDVVGTNPPFSFNWTGPNGFMASTQDIFNLEAGSYSLVLSDANGNQVTLSYTISEPPLLVGSIIQSGIDLTVNINGGVSPYSYTWNTGDTLATITPLSNGIYSCDVEDKLGCSITISFNVINMPSAIVESNSEREIIKILDLLGRDIKKKKGTSLLYIYDNGTVEKKIIIE